MQKPTIRIRGAREHNLQSIDVDLPRDSLVVVTGLSGSGKSSLAFDTLYAEGQRRYVESVSPYARQFLDQMQKPDVDQIEGLPPTISIEQRSGHATPRSTVATSTEVYDFLRLLYARAGRPHCPSCGKPIRRQTTQQIVDRIRAFPAGASILLLAPLVRGQKGTHKESFARARQEGFVRVRVDGAVYELRAAPELDKNRKHDVEVVVDRLVAGEEELAERLADSAETTLRLGSGILIASVGRGKRWTDHVFSQHFACPECGVSLAELSPRSFSFNSPYGACPACEGLGVKMELDPDLLVPDPSVALKDGAIEAWRRCGRRMAIRYGRWLREFALDFHVRLSTPWRDIAPDLKKILLHGTTAADEKRHGASFPGVIPSLERRFEVTESDFIKRRILSYMAEQACPSCRGARLKPEILAVRVGGKNIREFCALTIEDSLRFLDALELTAEEAMIARAILKEIVERLRFLASVGLGYLTLDRKSGSLSGGEAQRIRLASQVGSGLVGVCYVLDEPTIGLHQRDNGRLLQTLFQLRDLGNTVVVVEHDEETIRSADYVLDIGPGPGAHGGRVVAQGTPAEVAGHPTSATGRFLRGDLAIEVPARRREIGPAAAIEVRGAREHNLKSIDVAIPLRGFVCVTGVSGSGKSTLVHDVLYRGLRRLLDRTKDRPGDVDEIRGHRQIDKVVIIDQSPIGRTPRSNPATYTGVFDEIRRIFALTKEARARGYKPGRFSFNVKGGRCEACEGQGTKVIEMHFLPDVYVPCEECAGRRYGRETLEIRYRGRSVAEVLDLRVEEALELFANLPRIERSLRTLAEVGMGYIALGQPSTTLSGGEAQRIKLATELGSCSTGNALYILDEPTTGLHLADIGHLLGVLNRLVDAGNTVLVIEHNLHVVKTADWIVDLGPEGGGRGGEVVATGTPEDVARNPASITGRYLAPLLVRKPASSARRIVGATGRSPVHR